MPKYKSVLVALALACVCSPALAAALSSPPNSTESVGWSVVAGAVLGLGIGLGIAFFHIRSEARRTACFLIMTAVLIFGFGPAMAAPPVEPIQAPWGAWVALFLDNVVSVVLAFAIPILAKAIYGAIVKVAPWAALILTQQRVEMSLNAAKDYGLNAAKGAAKGKTLEIGEAIEVITRGTEYAMANAPGRVIESEGGADGIAERIFRKLDLPETANFDNVLAPALEWLRQNVPAAVAKGKR